VNSFLAVVMVASAVILTGVFFVLEGNMKAEGIRYFLMGIIIALLAVVAFKADSNGNMLMAEEAAGAGSGSANGIIVVTFGGGEFAVVDARNMRMGVYSFDSSRIKLKAARNIKYDLQVKTEISSSRGMSVTEAAKKNKRDR
jgi:hypothetical protein